MIASLTLCPTLVADATTAEPLETSDADATTAEPLETSGKTRYQKMVPAYRQLAFRVVNATKDFNDDAKSELALAAKLSRQITLLFLAGSSQNKIVVQDKGVEREFHRYAEFAANFQVKLTPHIETLLGQLYDCMEACPADQFASNMKSYFYDKDFAPKEKQYADEYPLIVNYIANWKEGDEITLTSAKSANAEIVAKKPDDQRLRIHMAKHCARLLVQAKVLPLFPGNYDAGFVTNVLFNAVAAIKDYSRKNNLCVERHAAHQTAMTALLAAVNDTTTLDTFVELLAANNYSVRTHFQEKWEDKFRDELVAGQEIQSSYPAFIFDFLRLNPQLWNGKDDLFTPMLEYIVAGQRQPKDHAVQPVRSKPALVFMIGMPKFSITEVDGQYLKCNVEIYPDGKKTNVHTLTCHIPLKYRSVAVREATPRKSDKMKSGVHYLFTFTDEKAFKAGNTAVTTEATLKSVLLRRRTTKLRGVPKFYLYLPLNMPWKDPVDDRHGDRIAQNKRDLAVRQIVAELQEDEIVATADLGINELYRACFAKKSARQNKTLHGKPKIDLITHQLQDDRLRDNNSTLAKQLKSVLEYARHVKAARRAIRTFDQKNNIKGKARCEELWGQIQSGKLNQPALTKMYHNLAAKYKQLHKDMCEQKHRLKATRKHSLWEYYQWIKLTKQVRSLLKGHALKGKVFRLGEKPDYTGVPFADLLTRLETTLLNQKKDFVKQLAAHFAEHMRQANVRTVFLENLRLFRTDAKRKKADNELLQIWSHRTIVAKLKLACAEYGIAVYDFLDPRYSSQVDPLTLQWLNRPKGSKVATDAQGNTHDADEVAAKNLIRRAFATQPDDLVIDVIFTNTDEAVAKDGTTLSETPDGWKKLAAKTKIIPTGKYVRLYRHDETYLTRIQHKKTVDSYQAQTTTSQTPAANNAPQTAE